MDTIDTLHSTHFEEKVVVICSVPNMLADSPSGEEDGRKGELFERQLRIGEEFQCLFDHRHRHVDR